MWLSTRDLQLAGSSKKLGPRFIGPFEIDSVKKSVAVRLSLPPTLKVHPVFHTSLLKPVSASPLCPPPPPPRVINGQPSYTVRSILDFRRRGKGESVSGRLGGVRSRGPPVDPPLLGSGPVANLRLLFVAPFSASCWGNSWRVDPADTRAAH
ncbi:uncharacterized protein LOC144033950 [Vanacampus margaritifer]